MTKIELTTVSTVYQHLIQLDWHRDWNELDNCLYSLNQLDDQQLSKEVEMQLEKHKKVRPKCVLDHNHAAGKCMTVATMAAAKAINKDYEPESVFTDAERYILEHYLAISHLEKAN